MSRHGRANRNVCGFDVANFTHHDDVWVLRKLAQTFGNVGRSPVSRRSARRPAAVFHRLLDRDDPTLDGIDAAKKTVERGGFPRRSPGQQDDSIRLREQMRTIFACLSLRSSRSNRNAFGAAEQRKLIDSPFTVGMSDAHVDVLIVRLQVDAAILRQTRSAMSWRHTFRRERWPIAAGATAAAPPLRAGFRRCDNESADRFRAVRLNIGPRIENRFANDCSRFHHGRVRVVRVQSGPSMSCVLSNERFAFRISSKVSAPTP